MAANGLAKLLEECGELVQVASKKLAYFSGEHPDGAGSLNKRMEEEIADVMAACLFVVQEFNLDATALTDRRDRKLALFHKWHREDGEECRE